MRRFPANVEIVEPVFFEKTNDIDYHIVKPQDLKKYASSKNTLKKTKMYLAYENRIDCDEIGLYDDTHFLCFIQYIISNFCLDIKYIERTSYAFRNYIYTPAYHLGTGVFNALLLHLNESKVIIKQITGSLSFADVVNNNWHKSIPFYADFNLHLYKSLPYHLKFHLFSDPEYKNEVELPTEWCDRKKFIENFTEEHNKSHSGASFRYDIIPR